MEAATQSSTQDPTRRVEQVFQSLGLKDLETLAEGAAGYLGGDLNPIQIREAIALLDRMMSKLGTLSLWIQFVDGEALTAIRSPAGLGSIDESTLHSLQLVSLRTSSVLASMGPVDDLVTSVLNSLSLEDETPSGDGTGRRQRVYVEGLRRKYSLVRERVNGEQADLQSFLSLTYSIQDHNSSLRVERATRNQIRLTMFLLVFTIGVLALSAIVAFHIPL